MFENNINQYIENINNILDNMNMFTKEELSCLNESIYNCLKNIINDNIEYIMNYNFDTYIKNYVVELFVSQLSEVYIDNIENLEIELQILIQININKIYKNFIPIR